MRNEEVGRLLDLARETLATAQWDLEGHFLRKAINNAYYAMFHAAQAMLENEGKRFSRHSAVKAAFGHDFAATGKLDRRLHNYLDKAFDARQTADYHTIMSLSEEDAVVQIQRAEEFLAAMEEYIQEHSQ